MKKTFLTILIAAVSLLFVTACSSNANDDPVLPNKTESKNYTYLYVTKKSYDTSDKLISTEVEKYTISDNLIRESITTYETSSLETKKEYEYIYEADVLKKYKCGKDTGYYDESGKITKVEHNIMGSSTYDTYNYYEDGRISNIETHNSSDSSLRYTTIYSYENGILDHYTDSDQSYYFEYNTDGSIKKELITEKNNKESVIAYKIYSYSKE